MQKNSVGKKENHRVGVGKTGAQTAAMQKCVMTRHTAAQRCEAAGGEGCTCQNNQSSLASTRPPHLAPGVGGLSPANQTPLCVFLNRRRSTVANLSIRRVDVSALDGKWHLCEKLR